MKKIFLLSVTLFIAMVNFAQMQTQQGISYRYNGKNPRTPLPNVTVECVTANNAVISDSTGSFTLNFNKLKMGDRIGFVTVKKREMMVFNQHAVDEWSIRKEPLCLILCDANEFEQQKQNLIDIGRREAQKKYDRQKAELQKQLDASEIDRAKYEVELDKAYEELDRLHKHLDEYADLFARIDESEIDSIAQQAIKLFNQGQMDEAVRLFEQGNYLEKLKASNRAIQQADNMIETAEAVKAKAEKDKEEQLQSLKAQVAAYKMQNEWEKAGELLKGLADELNTYESLFQYADFCQDQNRFDEAETYYEKVLPLVRELSQANPQAYELHVAVTLNELANLYCKIQRFTESEAMHLEALEISRRLAQDNPHVYEPNVAATLDNLGLVYRSTQRFVESEAMHLEALEIRRRLAQDNPQTYEPKVASTLNNLGILYDETQQFSKSEALFLEALQIRRQLAQTNPNVYASDVAQSLDNLGIHYKKVQQLSQSETAFLEALEIHRRMAQDNPQVYEPKVASTLFGLANLYETTKRTSESEIAYLEALEIYKRVAQASPLAYEPDVAKILNNLAVMYSKTQRFSECESAHLEALEIRRRLAQDNPQVYEPYVASTLNNLGALYFKTQRLTESNVAYMDAIKIYRCLAITNPKVFEPDLAQTLYNLGLLLYLKQEQNLEAIPIFEEAVTIYRRRVPLNPNHENCYENSLYCLTQLYPTINNHIKNHEALEELIPFLNGHYQEDPENWKEDYADALGSQACQCIFMHKFTQAEQYAHKALSIDSTQHWINTSLAASLLFQGKYTEAEAIYCQYKAELKDSFLEDFDDYEAAGVIPEERKADMEKIRKLLSE